MRRDNGEQRVTGPRRASGFELQGSDALENRERVFGAGFAENFATCIPPTVRAVVALGTVPSLALSTFRPVTAWDANLTVSG